jgi:hypothetical protein
MPFEGAISSIVHAQTPRRIWDHLLGDGVSWKRNAESSICFLKSLAICRLLLASTLGIQYV